MDIASSKYFHTCSIVLDAHDWRRFASNYDFFQPIKSRAFIHMQMIYFIRGN